MIEIQCSIACHSFESKCPNSGLCRDNSLCDKDPCVRKCSELKNATIMYYTLKNSVVKRIYND